MLEVSCVRVHEQMPVPLARRMEQLMTEMYGEYLPTTCDWVVTGETLDAVLDAATEHVKATHAVRSWPPEFWVHMRACIHEVE